MNIIAEVESISGNIVVLEVKSGIFDIYRKAELKHSNLNYIGVINALAFYLQDAEYRLNKV